MPRPKKPGKQSRLNLELPLPTRKKLEKLQKITNANSVTEVIQKAILVYEFFIKEQNLGQKFYNRGPSGEKEIVIL